MAISTCPKCGNHSYSLRETEPSGSAVKWYFVQCAVCGAPVGVVDFYPNSTLLKRMQAVEKLVKDLSASVSQIDYMIRQLGQRRN